jgi:diadenosine tetraphosphatase ApaH/serine/threonine PP2A family protein phosphatase
MRVAIFSDIHGNLEALMAVLEKLADFNIKKAICLGDVVGYGADPNACVAQIQESASVVMAGNHDWVAVGLADASLFNPIALAAIRWTTSQLTHDHADFLRQCPLFLDEDSVRYVHASPVCPDAWDYVSSPQWGRLALSKSECALCFIGHSHKAFICSESGQEDVVVEGDLCLNPAHRYLINVGSVGQPRDGDPRAAFVIWDQDTGNLALHRVSYNVSAAQAKIRSAGLPGFLADRLSVGM